MNNEQENKDNTGKQVALTVIAVLLVICMVVGLSYAYWKRTVAQETSNVIQSDCLNITLSDVTDAIDLEDAYPISDEEGEALSPYTFKITNTCSTRTNYNVTLEIMADTNRLSSEYVAVDFNDTGKKILSSYLNVEPTYSEDGETAVEARKLTNGSLEGYESVTYTLKLWIDESVTDDEAMDKYFSSKVSVTASQASGQTLAEYIVELASSDTTNLVSDDETNDHNTRYIGSNPKNYLCFDSKCTSGKWRAIGVMNNMTTLDGETKSLVKIVSDESIGSYAWNSNDTYDWSNGSLKTYLNSGDYWLENLANYSNIIENVVWKLGYVWSNSTPSYTYNYERTSSGGGSGLTYYYATWTGKVGLMYLSDYGLATSGGSTCLSYDLDNWYNYSECYDNDYLLDTTGEQWTLSISSTSGVAAWTISSGSEIYSENLTSTYNVHPSMYLVAGATIYSGAGTYNSPWIIGL